MEIVYADNNATTRVAPEVVEAMRPFFEESYFNPSSMYDAAHGPAEAIKEARASIARHLGGVRSDEILFTSCATESNNTAIFGAVRANPARRHVITTCVEHPAVLNVCKELEHEGLEVTVLPVDRQGRLDTADFVRALRRDTLLVTIMHANNETGVVFPVGELARIAKETDPGIIVHTDATQTVGKLAIDLSRQLRHVDMLAFSGHKLHAPKGVGCLFMRRGTACRPFLLGGHQEAGRRGGTENVAFIVGLARALELAVATHEDDEPHITAMRDRLERELTARIPLTEINGAGAPRLGNTSNLSCHFVEGEGILYQLSAAGICASSGSACTSGSLETSHVLRGMGIPFTAAHGSVRFSFSRYNRKGDVDHIVSVFPEVIASLRRLSPYWDNASDRPRPEAEGMLHGAPAGAPR
ncbi:MAG TPA: aminotransferase class V-fold PLP-dependent enzyme [Thermoanaerobaculaceae bacterium]|nr:aminotransferase class V-fold PLP-dependent enzyme [Thermoanaerobaculaceae bacterium]HPS77373.1 aminotransferase class V-fold PLP-dependent enzyme [Thermoanaerobaculaceae bacterium]